jgi:two-component system chemotaxis response regulator CheY
MIVDDSWIIRRRLKDLFENKGFEVVAEVESGEKAISKFKECKPDITTMDIALPGMSGTEAVESLIEIDPNAKIIMLTGMGERAMVLKAVKLGAVHFIVKPFQEDKVLEIVYEVLGIDPSEEEMIIDEEANDESLEQENDSENVENSNQDEKNDNKDSEDNNKNGENNSVHSEDNNEHIENSNQDNKNNSLDIENHDEYSENNNQDNKNDNKDSEDNNKNGEDNNHKQENSKEINGNNSLGNEDNIKDDNEKNKISSTDIEEVPVAADI